MANKIISSSNQGLGYIGTFLSQAVNDVNFQSIQSIFSDTSNPNNWTATEMQSAIDLIANTTTFLNGTSDVGFIPDAKNFLVGVFYNSLITRLQQLKGEIITIHDPLLKYTLNARVRGATDSKMYKSLVNNNQGNTPESSSINWLLLEPDITTYFKQPIILSNNITNPNMQIDFSSGNFEFSDKTNFATFTAMTGDLSLNFGNGLGVLDTGTKASSTRYYCYAIYNPTTQLSKVLCSLSAPNLTTGAYTGSNMPSGFTNNRYIGALRTNTGGNILAFNHLTNNYFEYKDIIVDRPNASVATTRSPALLTVPPLCIGLISCKATGPGIAGDADIYLSNLSISDNNAPKLSAGGTFTNSGDFIIRTNSLSQIGVKSSNANMTLSISTQGYYDLLI